jgi:hypothetical protein
VTAGHGDFSHEREAEEEVSDAPTRLDPREVSAQAWVDDAYARSGSGDLSGFADAALEDLAAQRLDPERRRALLRRLARPDVPGLVDLVLADLKHRHSGGFGSLPIHSLLTRAQLDEMAAREPSLLLVETFVHARLLRLRPGPDNLWPHDPSARTAYLDALWAHVKDLAPAFNALKVHVLYHRLDADRAAGVLDRPRFGAYVQLPRKVPYAAPRWIESCSREAASLGGDYHAVTGLPTVSDDSGLVAEFLARIFADAKDVKPYDTWIHDG